MFNNLHNNTKNNIKSTIDNKVPNSYKLKQSVSKYKAKNNKFEKHKITEH